MTVNRSFDLLRQEMHALRTDMREEMAALRTEMREEMRALRTDMHEEMRALRGEMREDVVALRADLAASQRQITQIGWGLVAALIAALAALLIQLA